ncbi:transcriptional regulator [bacterium]|nr:transcriptional regulator [bacterium]
MARPRTLPDSQVFAAILQLIAANGEKAVAFSAVSQATGLAGASLVQRYGALSAMVEAALFWAWDELDAMADAAGAEVAASDKGAQALLKALGERRGPLPMAALMAASLRHARLRARAAAWRARVEAMLAERLHSPEAASMLFAAWQGQILWEEVGARGFRLKDLVKRLG